MFFTPEISKRIVDEFNKIAGYNASCPLCRNGQFTVADGFATVTLHDAYPTRLPKRAFGFSDEVYLKRDRFN